ncbi:MAG: hypothetical protein Q8M29_19375 [Bacteroidota bacterium]|nr:hypothetical protein [Bacteroidota bacterium]
MENGDNNMGRYLSDYYNYILIIWQTTNDNKPITIKNIMSYFGDCTAYGVCIDSFATKIIW